MTIEIKSCHYMFFHLSTGGPTQDSMGLLVISERFAYFLHLRTISDLFQHYFTFISSIIYIIIENSQVSTYVHCKF